MMTTQPTPSMGTRDHKESSDEEYETVMQFVSWSEAEIASTDP